MLLDAPRLSVITSTGDIELTRLHAIFDGGITVNGRGELEVLLGQMLARNVPATPKTLDLIGHTTTGKALAIGDWIIDGSKAAVRAYFRELADLEVLPRLGIHAVRLLGCSTAESGPGRRTICVLAEILGIEVFGTRELICARQFDADGFIDDQILACGSDLRRDVVEPRATELAGPRILDLDALPIGPLPGERPWPVLVANAEQANGILRFVNRRYGTAMPGMLVTPVCEVVIPSRVDEAGHHRIEVVLDGELVRAYDTDDTGVVYVVDDPAGLAILLESLPRLRPAVE